MRLCVCGKEKYICIFVICGAIRVFVIVASQVPHHFHFHKHSRALLLMAITASVCVHHYHCSSNYLPALLSLLPLCTLKFQLYLFSFVFLAALLCFILFFFQFFFHILLLYFFFLVFV